jgi:hypothetical protein
MARETNPEISLIEEPGLAGLLTGNANGMRVVTAAHLENNELLRSILDVAL